MTTLKSVTIPWGFKKTCEFWFLSTWCGIERHCTALRFMSAEMLCYPVCWFCESLTDTSSGETVVASHPIVAPLLLNHLLCPHPSVTSCITVRGSAAWRQFFCLPFFLWLKCSISCSSPNQSWLFVCVCVWFDDRESVWCFGGSAARLQKQTAVGDPGV